MRNQENAKKPLHSKDTENQTFGCRHTNPDICSKHSLKGKCAFTSTDNICRTPPNNWKKVFNSLKCE
ncbi:hypothetical protein EAY71_23895 [Vibrio anguillarum]|nr:hypothetical protein [Vibrio anguillarum]MBF4425226.1 hypothetical protein [Vibrio anguillarum]